MKNFQWGRFVERLLALLIGALIVAIVRLMWVN